jgi:hypothetical protein
MRKSQNFLVTIDASSPSYDEQVALCRVIAKNHGCGLRLRGRLGQNNPNRALYAAGGSLYRPSSQDIRLEHATRVDVYLRK